MIYLGLIQFAQFFLVESSIQDIGSKKQLGFYPIVTNQMCMQCHGQPKTEISPETMAKLNVLYPEDKATGYKPNELRGIWVVEMDK